MKFNKLKQYCVEHDITYSDMLKKCNIVGHTQMALYHNKSVNLETIDRLCTYLHCQPSDIMELGE